MKKDTINNLFNNLEGSFDIETPATGHEARFLHKLENEQKVVNINKKTNYWRPFVAVAASIIIMISVFTISQNTNQTTDLASVSPEMATTQDFFTNTIASELEKLDEVKSPETQKLVDDAIFQISVLEKQYVQLRKDLSESGNDKRVIFAMITNFQNRIDIIENVKQLNDNKNENSTKI